MGGTRKLKAQIEEFLDKVLDSGQIFSRAFEIYLQKGAVDESENSLEEVQNIERAAEPAWTDSLSLRTGITAMIARRAKHRQ